MRRTTMNRALAQAVLLAAVLPVAQIQNPIPNFSTQREVKTAVVIKASAADVWRVLTDLPSYPIWNPYVYPAQGQIKSGAELEITLHESKTVTYKPKVLSADPPRELSWGGNFAGMFDRVLTFTLTPVEGADPPETRVEARELFRGLLLLAMGGVPDEAQHGLDQMTRALRNRVVLLQPFPHPR